MKTLLLISLFLAQSVFAAYRPVDAKKLVATKRTAVVTNLQTTKQWLLKGGATYAANWHTFLKTADLEAELKKVEPSMEVLQVVLNKWRKNKVGLEHGMFTITQKALKDYVRALQFSREGDFAQMYFKKETRIHAILSMPISDVSPEVQLELGELVGWFDYLGQTSELAAEAKKRFQSPNLKMRISDKMIAMGLEGIEIKNQKFVSNNMMGVSNQGWVYTTGKLSARPIPSKDQAVIEVKVNATINAPHISGSKGRIGISSSSSGHGWLTAHMLVNEKGPQVGQVWSQASMNTQVNGISAPGPFIERIAWRKVDRSSGEANYQASQATATQLKAEFQTMARQKIEEANQKFMENTKKTLKFEGTYPRSIKLSSSNEAIFGNVTEADAFQVGAPTNHKPEFTPGTDVGMVMHESFVSNFMEPYMGGKQEWDTSFYDIHKLLTMEEPAALRVHDNAPRWYFMIDERAPLTSRFDEDTITFRMLGNEIAQVTDGVTEKVNRPFEIVAVFHPKVVQGEPVLIREGEVKVNYLDGKGSDELSSKLQAMLHSKMSAFFPEVFEFGGLSIPKGSSWEKLRNLELVEFKVVRGWLRVAYKLKK